MIQGMAGWRMWRRAAVMTCIAGALLPACPGPVLANSASGASEIARVFTMHAEDGYILAIARIRAMAPMLPSSRDQWRNIRSLLVLDYLDVLNGNPTGDTQVFTDQCAICLAGELHAFGSSGSDPEWLREGDVILFRADRAFAAGNDEWWVASRVRLVDGYGTPAARLLTTRHGTFHDARIDCSGMKSAVVNGMVDRKTTDVGSLAEVIEAMAPEPKRPREISR